METLNDFITRTTGFNRTSLPQNGDLETSGGLSAKVDASGKFKPFIGNTTVFPLPADFIDKARTLQKMMYEKCGEFLAEPIDHGTFHITLHDLSNGAPSAETDSAIRRTEPAAMETVNEIRREKFVIRLKTTYLFNMVNTSAVLGFEPADEESHNKLMELYERFQSIVYLDYPLTPHMTVAYYKPGIITAEQLRSYQKVIDIFAAQTAETVELTGEMLRYMTFDDMNNYHIKELKQICL